MAQSMNPEAERIYALFTMMSALCREWDGFDITVGYNEALTTSRLSNAV